MPTFIDGKKAKEITPTAVKEMNFHDTKDLGRVHILRVWAGWIYYSFENAKVSSAVFVPQTTHNKMDETEENDQEQ